MEDSEVTNIPDNNYTEKTWAAMKLVIDEIIHPHAQLIRGLRTLRNSMSLEDPTPIADITLIDKAIQALEAHS